MRADGVGKILLCKGRKCRVFKGDVSTDSTGRTQWLDRKEEEAAVVRNDWTADGSGDVIAVKWGLLVSELGAGKEVLIGIVVAGVAMV